MTIATLIARDDEMAHFLQEAVFAWVDAQETRFKSAQPTIDRLERIGLAKIAHHGGFYHIAMLGLTGRNKSLRGALWNWLDQAKTRMDAQNAVGKIS